MLLDEVSRCWLGRLPQPPRESTISHMVLLFHRDKRMDAYINEPGMRVRVAAKHDVAEGDQVLFESIADALRVDFDELEIPRDVGYLVLLSQGWRRGVAYDFSPLGPGTHLRERSAERDLAALWTRLSFHDRLDLDEDDWTALMDAGWFPFIRLRSSRVRQLVKHARVGWDL